MRRTSTTKTRRVPDPREVESSCRIPSEDRCAALIEREGDTYQLSRAIRMSEPGRCSRRHSVVLRNRDGVLMGFCRTHARLALEGMMDERGSVLPKNSRDEMRRYKKGAFYRDLWEETS